MVELPHLGMEAVIVILEEHSMDRNPLVKLVEIEPEYGEAGTFHWQGLRLHRGRS